MCMGHAILNLKSAYARLAWPTHPGRTSQKAGFNTNTTFVYDNLSIKKIWMTLC